MAAMLTGQGDGGDGDLFADDDEDAEPSSVFRSAPSSTPVMTSALALRCPGDVFTGGMRQVKAKLAALHGDEAV